MNFKNYSYLYLKNYSNIETKEKANEILEAIKNARNSACLLVKAIKSNDYYLAKNIIYSKPNPELLLNVKFDYRFEVISDLQSDDQVSLFEIACTYICKDKRITYMILKYLIDNCEIDLNAKIDNYETILYCFAGDSPDFFKYLIEKGADINVKTGRNFEKKLPFPNSNGSTILHKIAKNCYESESEDYQMQNYFNNFEYLIELGIDIDVRNQKGQTPLYLAASKSISICSILIKNGANVNNIDIFGDTSLSNAATNGKYHIAKLLIDNGAISNV